MKKCQPKHENSIV
ncbi:unnamed protein product [Acanthoscelides obtectus]|uniref:Uncharacterized protein n=1 Tax=Acanthoscelides obtectus TaxID=200917 RepID=A0A9P0LWD3_ACAOB|nr:unnamed protein product [Acanthoscelides obtectus]CAK1675380.1 hypothetical protein AOBTE_LOCUS30182 [Acanthoscelides obtectus]